MADAQANRPTVLIVDDEQDLADAYALRLGEAYDVRTAYSGVEALETVSDDVDVVLLDRRMPDLSGDEVLEALAERTIDCRVIMVTAVNPDFDIVELGFNDYLCKPVGREGLVEAIDRQLHLASYDDALTAYAQIASKIGLLEAEKLPHELEQSDEYDSLVAEAERLKREVDDQLAGVDEVELAFREI